MTFFEVIVLLLTVCAVFSYINVRFLKLPNNIGLMALSVIVSLIMILESELGWLNIESIKNRIADLRFSQILLKYMLGFLLFAGALHVKAKSLYQQARPVISITIIGVLLSTAIVGVLFYLACQLFHLQVPLIYCFLFGALISPTDPIAVLSILKKAGVPKKEEIVITGESLFNDGVGIVLFISILHLSGDGSSVGFNINEVFKLLFLEVGGGLLFGYLTGWLAYFIMRSIDHYQTEVMITLSLVMGGYLLAEKLHVSAPLAMVVAGLVVGNKGRESAMSQTTVDYIDKFWELIDELLNALLFVLMGLVFITLENISDFLAISIVSILIVLIARYAAVALPVYLFRYDKTRFGKRFPYLLTWGGLRGGISLALALSLPATEYKSLIITNTYTVVVFTILVQGLTLEWFVKKLYTQQ